MNIDCVELLFVANKFSEAQRKNAESMGLQLGPIVAQFYSSVIASAAILPMAYKLGPIQINFCAILLERNCGKYYFA